jgi:NADPH:quinone reductase-like Zn-dependent oxidoreductase
MRAVVTEPGATGCLVIAEVPEPSPDSDEALVRVKAFSLNRGEVRRAATQAAGTTIGWDVAGVVEAPARNGGGPRQGARVVGFSRRVRGWAEHIALPTTDLAEIPDHVSDADAATLPVAGLTALYALERCERLLASRVLVTGATGGVGYFACQLARLMGAHVTALLRRRDQETLARSLGVEETVISPDGAGLDAVRRFRAIIDGVGGPMLGQLLLRLDDDGRAILYGVSAGQETTLAIRDLMLTGNGRLEGFYLTRDIQIERASKGLSRLLRLLGDGRLRTLVSIDADWSTVGATAARLLAREFPGKAVLRIS